MSEEKKHVMTSSTEVNATMAAAMTRIAAVPAGETLIASISDDEWVDGCNGNWMINAGSDTTGCSEELDDSDEVTVEVA